MEAIKITVIGTQAYPISTPVLTAGTVGQSVEFIFDEAWEGLSRTAVFRAGGMTKDVVGIGTDCTVPWEVMEKTGCCLHIGVYGTNADGTKVIPTVWAKLDPILPGADPSGDESADPTLPVWEQINKAAVKTVNGTAPDENGNVELTALDDKPTSWNDLTDKPFYDTPTGGDTLTWDGNTEGKYGFSAVKGDVNFYVKVSDAVPDPDTAYGKVTFYLEGSGETSCEIEPLYDGSECRHAGDAVIFVYSDNTVLPAEFNANGNTEVLIKEKGTYFYFYQSLCYISKLHIPGFTGYPGVKTIEEKYLPAQMTTPLLLFYDDTYIYKDTTLEASARITKTELLEAVQGGRVIWATDGTTLYVSPTLIGFSDSYAFVLLVAGEEQLQLYTSEYSAT